MNRWIVTFRSGARAYVHQPDYAAARQRAAEISAREIVSVQLDEDHEAMRAKAIEAHNRIKQLGLI